MARYTITDMVSADGFVTVEADEVAEAIVSWFPEAPPEVYAQVALLQHALVHGEPAEAHAVYLGVRVDPA